MNKLVLSCLFVAIVATVLAQNEPQQQQYDPNQQYEALQLPAEVEEQIQHAIAKRTRDKGKGKGSMLVYVVPYPYPVHSYSQPIYYQQPSYGYGGGYGGYGGGGYGGGGGGYGGYGK